MVFQISCLMHSSGRLFLEPVVAITAAAIIIGFRVLTIFLSFSFPPIFCSYSVFVILPQGMDHSQVSSDAEEGCSSCESGWTDYLVSPVQSTDEEEMVDNINNTDGSGERKRADNIRINHKGEDNDSFASDASSGPTHRKHAGKNRKNCRSTKVEKEDAAAILMERSSEGSSSSSNKTNFNTSKKERSVDRKTALHWKPLVHASGSAASHGSNEVRRKR